MATSIGAITCDVVNAGRISGLRESVVTWTNPGHNGVGAHLVGQHGEGSQITAEHWDTIANIRTWKANLEALVGTIVSVTDNYAVVTTNVLVLDARTDDHAIIHAGTNKARGTAALRVVRVA